MNKQKTEMTLEEAIEITTKYLPTHRWPPNPNLQAAMKRLIEAGKREQENRQVNFTKLLPCETKD